VDLVGSLFGWLVVWFVGCLDSYLASYKQLMYTCGSTVFLTFPHVFANEQYTKSDMSRTLTFTVMLPDNFVYKSGG